MPATYEAAEAFTAEINRTGMPARYFPIPPVGSDRIRNDSVSEYFTPENARIAEAPVRQKPVWEEMQNDPVFAFLPATFTPMSLEEAAVRTREAVPEAVPEPDPAQAHDPTRAILQALGEGSNSATSTPARPIARPVPRAPPVPTVPTFDPEQEARLAALGISGSAQPVYPTPGPAYAPRAPPSSRSPEYGFPTHSGPSSVTPPVDSARYGRPSTITPPVNATRYGPPSTITPPVSSTRYGPGVAPPPPPPAARDPARSPSVHTERGSDFGDGDTVMTNAASVAGPSATAGNVNGTGHAASTNNHNTNKRQREEDDDGASSRRQSDDTGPKKRQTNRPVNPAYGWVLPLRLKKSSH